MNPELSKALLAVQKEAPALQRDGINPHFQSKFVTLETLMESILPVLNKHGIVLMQLPERDALITALIHADSGESESAITPLMLTKDDPQSQGSAITYARRYALMSMLGLVADTDDDGNAAGQPRGNGGKASPRRSDAPSRTPEFDPGRDLMEGAIRVMGEKDANTVWAALRALDDTQDWEAVQDFAAQHVFGVDRERLTAPQWGEFWKRLANTVVKAGELVGTGDFPPADPEKLSEAFAWGFEGVQISFGGTTVEKKE